MRRGGVLLGVVAGVVAVAAVVVIARGEQPASAHAALVISEPGTAAMLEAAPTSVKLTFTEDPEPSLSEIRVLDMVGTAFQAGPPQPVPGDRRSLVVPLRQADQGLYTVNWRALSRIDGHPTAGSFTFGIGVLPSQPVDTATTTSARPPATELAGRWVLIAGLALLLGTAIAARAGFGSTGGGVLGVIGWGASAAGVLLLADGQRHNAGGSLGALWTTPVGRALAWRASAILVAGIALVRARR
ncbi:MAG: copper resistance CopC family protein, partial [Acidimicrobiales bacterium]